MQLLPARCAFEAKMEKKVMSTKIQLPILKVQNIFLSSFITKLTYNRRKAYLNVNLFL